MNYKTKTLGMNIRSYKAVQIEPERIKEIVENQHKFLFENPEEPFIYNCAGDTLILSHNIIDDQEIHTYITYIKAEGWIETFHKNKKKAKNKTLIKRRIEAINE